MGTGQQQEVLPTQASEVVGALQDVEQILNAHGLTATGASQVLANLHKLLAAAASA